MTDTPNDDRPGFVAEEPERCSVCFRLIRPGQTCYLTIEHEVLCADCALVEEVSRVRHDLAVALQLDGVPAENVHPFESDTRNSTLRGLHQDRWHSRERPSYPRAA